jgi:hypothetical protein
MSRISDEGVLIEDGADPDTPAAGAATSSFGLVSVVATYSALLCNSPARLQLGRFELSLRRDFLPRTLQAVYGRCAGMMWTRRLRFCCLASHSSTTRVV